MYVLKPVLLSIRMNKQNRSWWKWMEGFSVSVLRVLQLLNSIGSNELLMCSQHDHYIQDNWGAAGVFDTFVH